jgi:hypothetical protein
MYYIADQTADRATASAARSGGSGIVGATARAGVARPIQVAAMFPARGVVMLAFILVFVTFFRSLRRGLIDPQFRALFASMIAMLGIGTVFYRNVEGWDWLDALYFCVITLATIGYGDLTPKTPIGKAFTIVFVLIGIGMLAAFFSKLATVVLAAEDGERGILRHRKPNVQSKPDDPPATD